MRMICPAGRLLRLRRGQKPIESLTYDNYFWNPGGVVVLRTLQSPMRGEIEGSMERCEHRSNGPVERSRSRALRGPNSRLSGSATCGTLAVACLVSLWVGSASAEIYRFVDTRGTIHFTDMPVDDRWEIVHFRRAPGWRPQGASSPPRTERFDVLIADIAGSLDIEPALVKAVIAAESNFDPTAVSTQGALGLMQLMPSTAASLEVDDPLHPDQNVRGGTRYLRAMIDRFGNLEHALAAYNAGPSPVDLYDGIPPYPETQDYVHRVLTYYRHYYDDFP